MKARVLFRMGDRREYTFEVEADDQRQLYDQAKELLNIRLTSFGDSVPNPLPRGFFDIVSWQTVLKEGGPAVNKTDGIAARSTKQKLRFDLIPMGPLAEVAKVLTFGAYHYGDRNWEEGFSWSRCVGSVWRHLSKWLLGEDLDDESGINHLAHVVANCLFLLEYMATKPELDDRRKRAPEQIAQLFAPYDPTITKETGDGAK